MSAPIPEDLRKELYEIGVGFDCEGEPFNVSARILCERIAALEAHLVEVEEYLPPESPAYQSVGERAKLLKDQMEYAAESSGELGRALATSEAQSKQLREALTCAAMSLETISKHASRRDTYLNHPEQVRGYANSRASVARIALAATEPSHD